VIEIGSTGMSRPACRLFVFGFVVVAYKVMAVKTGCCIYAKYNGTKNDVVFYRF
jgi:hypothetical protein